MQVIERTEAAKKDLLGRAKLLGVPDDDVRREELRVSRRALPLEFGKKARRGRGQG